MGYLDNTGLTYFWGKIKAAFGATLSVSGRTVTLKSKSGATLSTITTQDTTYSAATTSANGLMSSGDKTKLNGVATGATKNSITTTTVTLTVAKWSNKSQSVSVSGVTASNLVIVSVDNTDNGIKCTAQGSGTLTFTCETLPTAGVTASVAVLS